MFRVSLEMPHSCEEPALVKVSEGSVPYEELETCPRIKMELVSGFLLLYGFSE